MANKLDTKDQAYVDNYPPLKEWLDKHEARCGWQVPLSKREEMFIESWMLPNGREFIIVVRSHRRGWDIFTPSDSLEIAKTLEDAEQRLGLGGLGAVLQPGDLTGRGAPVATGRGICSALGPCRFHESGGSAEQACASVGRT